MKKRLWAVVGAIAFAGVVLTRPVAGVQQPPQGRGGRGSGGRGAARGGRGLVVAPVVAGLRVGRRLPVGLPLLLVAAVPLAQRDVHAGEAGVAQLLVQGAAGIRASASSRGPTRATESLSTIPCPTRLR